MLPTSALQSALRRGIASERPRMMCHVLALHFEQEKRTPKPHTALLSQCFYHTSVRRESMLIIGGAGMLAAGVLAGKFLEMSASEANKIEDQPKEGESQDNSDNKMSSTSTSREKDTKDETATAKVHQEHANVAQEPTAQAKDTSKDHKAKVDEEKKEKSDAPSAFDEIMTELYGIFGADWKSAKAGFFAKNFYDGGFEEKMTRREAALILGVRENTAAQRIKESHRRILLLNHPDRGGSPYVAAKINLAKDLLLQGKGK